MEPVVRTALRLLPVAAALLTTVAVSDYVDDTAIRSVLGPVWDLLTSRLVLTLEWLATAIQAVVLLRDRVIP